MKIKIYTDGACIGNPGPGGWAAIVMSENNKKEKYEKLPKDLEKIKNYILERV